MKKIYLAAMMALLFGITGYADDNCIFDGVVKIEKAVVDDIEIFKISVENASYEPIYLFSKGEAMAAAAAFKANWEEACYAAKEYYLNEKRKAIYYQLLHGRDYNGNQFFPPQWEPIPAENPENLLQKGA